MLWKFITTVLRFDSINFPEISRGFVPILFFKENCKNLNWTLGSPPKIFVDARSMQFPRIYH